MTTNRIRRALGAAAVLALGVGGIILPATLPVGDAGATQAAERLPSLVDLDTSKRGSITVHKRVKSDFNGTTEGNGAEDVAGNGYEKLAGATFQVQRIPNFDLTTAQGWQSLSYYNGDVDMITAGGGLVDYGSKTTDVTGDIKFDNLPLGVYVVTETSTPAGYAGSAPFIVTVPMTEQNNRQSWMYDIHVYPKNAKVNVEKSVNDENARTNHEDLAYTLTGDVPDSDSIGFYTLHDAYDARLTPKLAELKIKITNTKNGTDVDLDSGIDYYPTMVTPAGNERYLILTMTDEGRRVMAENRDGAKSKVVVTVPFLFQQSIGNNGRVDNTVRLLTSEPANNWNETSTDLPVSKDGNDWPSAKVTSKYATVKITKESTIGATKLAGVEFNLYKCTPTELVGSFTSVDASLDQKLVDYQGNDTFTTGTDGTLVIDALRNNDWQNHNSADPLSGAVSPDWYCLVETKAADGYELAPKPIAFQILENDATPANNYQVETIIQNSPKNGGFNLPLTGGAGIATLVGIGIVLVGGAGALTFLNRRRSEADES